MSRFSLCAGRRMKQCVVTVSFHFHTAPEHTCHPLQQLRKLRVRKLVSPEPAFFTPGRLVCDPRGNPTDGQRQRKGEDGHLQIVQECDSQRLHQRGDGERE